MLGQALQGLVVGSCVGGISEVVGDDAGQVSKVVLHCNAFGECLHLHRKLKCNYSGSKLTVCFLSVKHTEKCTSLA